MLKEEQHKKEIYALKYPNPESVYTIKNRKTNEYYYCGSDEGNA